MYIKPYLREESGRGKSGFAVNRGAVNRGFTVLTFLWESSTEIPSTMFRLTSRSRIVAPLTSQFHNL